ncbi:hypothetical protein ID866_6667 [Astraeus odoratus]|nr:hypothetical protein ID866_6667 [Astraeus odoratus]
MGTGKQIMVQKGGNIARTIIWTTSWC